MAFRTDRVELLGSTINVRRSGAGAPLLFLHDSWSPIEWSPFFARLSEQFAVVVPDHPGFGESDTPAWLRNVADMAYYYLDFIDAMDLRGAHVVGSSVGGWVAAEVAVRNPDVFGTINLLAPAGIRVLGEQSGDVFIWDAAELAEGLFCDPGLVQQGQHAVLSRDQIEVQLKNKYTTARLAWEPRFFNPDIERWLHRIKQPVQVLWGDDDRVFPSSYASAWNAKLPRCRVDTIERCGHLPHVERPDITADKVIRFIKEAAR